MTYLQFLLVFVVPPLVILIARRPWRALGPRAGMYLPIIALIAFIYATPWDNYLVWREVWRYDPTRVLGVVGYVPVEEYLFFILQPLLAGSWLYFLLGRGASSRDNVQTSISTWPGAAAYLAIAVAGAISLARPEGTYLGLILVWAAPVLAAQWAYAGRRIVANGRAALLGILVPTLYLWIADAVAIRSGIWSISAIHTYGLSLFGLPLEEAVFFLATNVLVVQGLILFVDPPRLEQKEASSMNQPRNANA